MKRTRLFVFTYLALAVLSACVRENAEEYVPDAHTILAYIDNESPQTRAIAVDKPGISINTYWQAGDRIGIIGGGRTAEFSVAAGDISADGKSANFRSKDAVPSGSLVAFSPWQEGASASGNKLNINFPATQNYSLHSGVAQPDPANSIMVACGSASRGLPFRNVMAVLKIGQVFDENVTIRKVEFRDLSDKAVCGPMTVDPDNDYATEISGGGTVLTLDCGEGVSLQKNELGKFFIIVPARSYPKGFEITFIATDGQRFTRQAGVDMGTTLKRSMVYPVGEVPARDYVAADANVQFAEGAILMDSDVADKIKIISREERELSTGTRHFTMPAYKIMAQKDLGLKQGGWIIMEASDELPSGGVFRVDSKESYSGYDLISLEPETNPAQVYRHLEFGDEIWTDEGELIEDGGLEFDLGAYLSGIKDSEGNDVPFSVSPSGQILFSEEATEQLLGTKGLSRIDKSVTTPSVSYQIGEDGCSLTLGASMTVTMKAAARIEDGELHFLHFTVHPVLNLSADFELSKEWTKSWEKSLITLYFVPGVPIAPGLVMEPNLNFSAGVSVSADIKFTAGMSYSYDCGTFGCSYNAGDGFFFRYQKASGGSVQMAPQMDYNLYGSLSAGVHLGINPALHIWGLMEVGIDTDLSLSLGLSGDMNDGIKLALTPGISFTPRTVALGGWLTKKWDQLAVNLELDPLWEKYLFPKGTRYFGKKLKLENVVTTVLSTNPDGTQNIKTCSLPPYRIAIINQVPTDVGFSWVADYDTEKLMFDWDLYLFIYSGTGLRYYVSPGYLTFNSSMADYGYNFTDYTGRHIEIEALKDTGDRATDDILAVLENARVSRKIKLCHLGTGEKNERKEGTVWPGFAPGQPYGYAFAWVRGDYEFEMTSDRGPQGWFRYIPDPKSADDDRSIKLVETTDGSIIPGSGYYGFRLFWPNTPLGNPWWVYRTINPEAQYWWLWENWE